MCVLAATALVTPRARARATGRRPPGLLSAVLGTPDSAGWPDPVDDERDDYRDTYREDGGDDVGDDEPLVSIATEPPPSTTPAAPPEPAPAASKKSGKSGKSGKKPKTKRWRDADVDDDMDAAAVQARERARAKPSGAAPRPAARLLLRPLSLHANCAPSCCPPPGAHQQGASRHVSRQQPVALENSTAEVGQQRC